MEEYKDQETEGTGTTGDQSLLQRELPAQVVRGSGTSTKGKIKDNKRLKITQFYHLNSHFKKCFKNLFYSACTFSPWSHCNVLLVFPVVRWLWRWWVGRQLTELRGQWGTRFGTAHN